MPRRYLGEILIDEGMIRPEHLAEALKVQRRQLGQHALHAPGHAGFHFIDRLRDFHRGFYMRLHDELSDADTRGLVLELREQFCEFGRDALREVGRQACAQAHAQQLGIDPNGIPHMHRPKYPE